MYIVDITQGSFPVASVPSRLYTAVHRIFKLIDYLRSKRIVGVIIFSDAGLSFYEKTLMSLVCKFFKTKDLLFIRSGFFKDQVKSSKWRFNIAKQLLRIPYKVGGQGSAWENLYLSLGVPPQKIEVVHNWLSPDSKITVKSLSTTKPNCIKFVFVGWLVHAKGVKHLIDAAIILSEKYEFKLTIIGGGTLESDLLNAVNENNLSQHVTLTGWQSKEEVAEKLTYSDVFILPSLAEGFPNAMVEALGSGLPCIATDVGGIADSLVDGVNGYLLQDNEPETIAQAMRNYIDNPDLVKKHSVEALNIVKKNHDWETNCRKIFDLFE